jgi:NADPH:quinone reductase-like Zn-dependent oxidoreductase
MQAVVVSEFGGPEQLRLTEAAAPVPGRSQVRIRVRAAGVNPVDAGNRADGSWHLRVPCVLGYDVAGDVESLGPSVSGLRVGDRVMAMTHFPDGGGGYAEFTVADADLVAPIADETSFTQAAATPLAAGTAELVLDRLSLGPDSRLLVTGGSGGVGLFLLQMAARRGIEAIGVGRTAMHEPMRALGAAACLIHR